MVTKESAVLPEYLHIQENRPPDHIINVCGSVLGPLETLQTYTHRLAVHTRSSLSSRG